MHKKDLNFNISCLAHKEPKLVLKLLYVEAGLTGNSRSSIKKKLSTLRPEILAEMLLSVYEDNKAPSIINFGGTQ